MLNFVGCGSAFNTALGNNSAYMKFDDTLFMIDCGSANFGRIKRANLLDGIKHIDVLITHLHPDHIGSLGDLIFYTYYNMRPMFGVKVRLLIPQELEIDLRSVLQMEGVTQDKYVFDVIKSSPFVSYYGLTIALTEVEHAEELKSYGFLLTMGDKHIYYSGDSNMIPSQALGLLIEGDIHYFYQDTCKADYPDNVHLSLIRLCELIPQEYRSKVYCMHLDETFNVDEARAFGFNVVTASC